MFVPFCLLTEESPLTSRDSVFDALDKWLKIEYEVSESNVSRVVLNSFGILKSYYDCGLFEETFNTSNLITVVQDYFKHKYDLKISIASMLPPNKLPISWERLAS